MAYNPIPVIGGANWQGNTQLATRNQLISSISGLYDDIQDIGISTLNVGNFTASTLTVLDYLSSTEGFFSTLHVLNYISTPNIYTSSVIAERVYASTIEVSTLAIPGAFINNSLLSISTGDFSLVSLSTLSLKGIDLSGIKFNFDLDIGTAIGGLLGGIGAVVGGALIGIGTVLGLTIQGLETGLGTIIAGRPVNNISQSVFETINFQTQLQVSTLGFAHPYYSSIFRTVSSVSADSVPGAEMFVSTIFPANTKCIRSVSDPLSLITTNSNINTSTLQSFGQWIPILNDDYMLRASNVEITGNINTPNYFSLDQSNFLNTSNDYLFTYDSNVIIYNPPFDQQANYRIQTTFSTIFSFVSTSFNPYASTIDLYNSPQTLFNMNQAPNYSLIIPKNGGSFFEASTIQTGIVYIDSRQVGTASQIDVPPGFNFIDVEQGWLRTYFWDIPNSISSFSNTFFAPIPSTIISTLSTTSFTISTDPREVIFGTKQLGMNISTIAFGSTTTIFNTYPYTFFGDVEISTTLFTTNVGASYISTGTQYSVEVIANSTTTDVLNARLTSTGFITNDLEVQGKITFSNALITYEDTADTLKPGMYLKGQAINDVVFQQPPNDSDILSGLLQQVQETIINDSFFSTTLLFQNSLIPAFQFWSSITLISTPLALIDTNINSLLTISSSSSNLNLYASSITSSPEFYINTKEATSSLIFNVNPITKFTIPPGSTIKIQYELTRHPLILFDGVLDNSGIQLFIVGTQTPPLDPNIVIDGSVNPYYYITFDGFLYSYPQSNVIHFWNPLITNLEENAQVYDVATGDTNVMVVQPQPGSNINTGTFWNQTSNFLLSDFELPGARPSTIINYNVSTIFGHLQSPLQMTFAGYNVLTENINTGYDSTIQTTSTLGNISFLFSTITFGETYQTSNTYPITFSDDVKFNQNVFLSNSPNPITEDYRSFTTTLVLDGSNYNYNISGISYNLSTLKNLPDWIVGYVPAYTEYTSTVGQFNPMKVEINGQLECSNLWTSNTLISRLRLYSYNFQTSTILRQYTQAINPCMISLDQTTSKYSINFNGAVFASTASVCSDLQDPTAQMGLGINFFSPNATNNNVGFNIGDNSYIDFCITSLGYAPLPPPIPPPPPAAPVEPSTIADLAIWFETTTGDWTQSGNTVLTWSNLGTLSITPFPATPYPLPETGIHTLNGKNVFYFPETAEIVNSWQWVNIDKTLFFVSRVYNDLTYGSPNVFLITQNSAGAMYSFISYDQGNNYFTVGLEESGGTGIKTTIPNPSTPTIYALRNSISTSSNAIWVNTSTMGLITSGAANYNNTIPYNMQIQQGSNGTAFDVGDIMVYDRALTTSEVQQVIYYLQTKWNIL